MGGTLPLEKREHDTTTVPSFGGILITLLLRLFEADFVGNENNDQGNRDQIG